MIDNADITIFNKRMGENRREIYIPTIISGVCWYDVRSMRQNERNRTGESSFIIRIPFDAQIQNKRNYISAVQYKKLPEEEISTYWSLQLNDYVVKGQYEKKLFSEEINEIRKLAEDFVTIIEYADNTIRGSVAVKHWRIGGT